MVGFQCIDGTLISARLCAVEYVVGEHPRHNPDTGKNEHVCVIGFKGREFTVWGEYSEVKRLCTHATTP